MLRTTFCLLAAVMLIAVPADADPLHLVACAPGYPGSTAQAQPTMDEFARLLESAAGWDQGQVTAEYQETEAGGVARIGNGVTQLALVPLPLFFKYQEQLDLQPIAQIVGPEGTATETWSLVAAAGRIDGPEALAGWTLMGIPAYSEAFVRGNLLGVWGTLPANVHLEFTRRVLAGVRRATSGEDVAILLDGAQTAALASLPNADALEIVATSGGVLMGLVVSVGGRLRDDQRATLVDGLLKVHENTAFGEVLSTIRVTRFSTVDHATLAAGREAFDRAR